MERKTALVTGAGGGIGKATVAHLLERRFRVVAVYHRPDPGGRAPEREGVIPVAMDVGDRKAVHERLKLVEPVHVVVANAGICRTAWMNEARAYRVWQEVLRTNLDGVFHTIDAVLANMVDGGRIVMVSSGLGKLGRPGYGAYTASKHAVLGLMKCLAREVARRRITVNAVCPGWVDTDMAAADLQTAAERQGRSLSQMRREALCGIPLGRFVQPEEVASLIGYLCSERAAAITGQAFNISCGELPSL